MTRTINLETTARIMAEIVHCLYRLGRAPSLVELARVGGLHSTSSVYRHLEELENRGLIERDKLVHRAVRLTKRGAEWAAKHCPNIKRRATHAEHPGPDDNPGGDRAARPK